MFRDFINKGLETGGIDVNILNILLLLGIVDVSDQLLADFTDQIFRNLTDNLSQALNSIT